MLTDVSNQPVGGFGKHYSRMYTGSMVGAGAIVFAVMGYVIANQTPNFEGEMIVELNPKLLGFILGEKPDLVIEAIKFLCAPDKSSRTKTESGRRLIKEGEFSYLVVNGRQYRAMGDPARRREQNREAKRRERRNKGLAASEIITRNVMADPLTKQDKSEMRKKGIAMDDNSIGDGNQPTIAEHLGGPNT